MKMIISDELVIKIQQMEEELEHKRNCLTVIETQKERKQELYDSIISKFGWREKYLDGRFLGDKKSINHAHRLNQEIKYLDEQVQESSSKLEESDKKIIGLLTKYVQLQDIEYIKLGLELKKIHNLTYSTDNFFRKINAARFTIDTTNIKTGNVSDTKLYSLEQKLVIKQMRDAISQYFSAIKDYSTYLKNKPAHLEEANHLDSDLNSNRYNFTNIFGLLTSDKIELQISEFQTEVKAIKQYADKRYGHINGMMISYVKTMRDYCNQTQLEEVAVK